MTSQTSQKLHRHNIRSDHVRQVEEEKSTAHVMKLFKDTQLGYKLDYRDTVLDLNDPVSVILAKCYT